jgi:hypothetical protein
MTARAIATDVDPTGLGGHRYVRNEKQAPYVVELWAYPASIGLETIKAEWLKVLPRAKHLTGFKEEGVRGGKRLVTIDRYESAPNKPPHIEEPLDV